MRLADFITNTRITQETPRIVEIIIRHENAVLKNADRAFHNTHMLIGEKKIDIALLQQVLHKVEKSWVV